MFASRSVVPRLAAGEADHELQILGEGSAIVGGAAMVSGVVWYLWKSTKQDDSKSTRRAFIPLVSPTFRGLGFEATF